MLDEKPRCAMPGCEDHPLIYKVVLMPAFVTLAYSCNADGHLAAFMYATRHLGDLRLVELIEPEPDQQPTKVPPDHNAELWSRIPVELRRGILAYILDAQAPGGFLRAIFENDLHRAIAVADGDNFIQIPNVVAYMYGCAPAPCIGSKDKVKAWLHE